MTTVKSGRLITEGTINQDRWNVARLIRANPQITYDQIIKSSRLGYIRVAIALESLFESGDLIELDDGLCVTSAIGSGL